MRHDAPVPTQVVLDLLARADALAAAASQAIAAGDDDALAALLDDREAVVGAVVRACRDVRAERPLADQLARVTAATQASVVAGRAARAAALVVRDQVAAELSLLDARQQASHEYHDTPPRSIDVVL